MLTQDQMDLLKAPFPPEALTADTSRGFELTSIKAAYVIERLNDAFGPCGTGWRYSHSSFDDVATADGRLEVVTEVALQYRSGDDSAGCGRVTWTDTWEYSGDHGWSEPIFACGGKGLGRGGAPYTDARKSAVTDGLTKAASMIGVGHRVFKGHVLAPAGRVRSRHGNGGDQKDNPTTFWRLYNDHAKPRGISSDKAKELAGNGDWTEACNKLKALISEA